MIDRSKMRGGGEVGKGRGSGSEEGGDKIAQDRRLEKLGHHKSALRLRYSDCLISYPVGPIYYRKGRSPSTVSPRKTAEAEIGDWSLRLLRFFFIMMSKKYSDIFVQLHFASKGYERWNFPKMRCYGIWLKVGNNGWGHTVKLITVKTDDGPKDTNVFFEKSWIRRVRREIVRHSGTVSHVKPVLEVTCLIYCIIVLVKISLLLWCWYDGDYWRNIRLVDCLLGSSELAVGSLSRTGSYNERSMWFPEVIPKSFN